MLICENAKYRLIMDFIINDINNDTLRPGSKVYSENKLMQMFNVSRNTAREALMLLSMEGYIKTYQGKGSYVVWQKEHESFINGYAKTIYVLFSYTNNHTYPEILSEIKKKAESAGYRVVVNCSFNSVYRQRKILKQLIDSDIAGIIIEPCKSALPDINQQLFSVFRKKKIPVIFLHSFYNDVDDYVVVDDADAGYKAAEYLIENGHTNICAILKSDDMQGRQRYKGIVSAMVDNDCIPENENIIWIDTENEMIIFKNAEAVKLLTEKISKYSALICYNDDLAVRVADMLISAGIKVPENISIVSFDNTRFGTAYRVPVTSMNHPYGEIGKEAINSLFMKLENSELKIEKQFKVNIVEKNSVKTIKTQRTTLQENVVQI